MEEAKRCFPGWEVVRSIGSGTFGKVYEIKRVDGFGEIEHSAMKIISVPMTSTEVSAYRDDGYDDASLSTLFRKQVEGILSEYRLMSKLKGNSNIVSYEDHAIIPHETDPGWDILIRMELLTSLPNYFNTVQKDGVVEEAVVIRLGEDICKALELCEKHQIIHRDIKPQNILISANGDFKLGDFGIARTADHTTKATKTGTYGYMAPEVYKTEAYNAAADICSLGLVMYWMLNARRGPFQVLPPEIPSPSQNVEALERRMSGEALPRPLHGSDALCEVVLKACAYTPGDRFTSPEDMRKALERIEKPGSAAELPRLSAGEITSPEPVPEGEEETVGPFHKTAPEDCADEKESAEEEQTIGLFSAQTARNGKPAEPEKIRKQDPPPQSGKSGSGKRILGLAVATVALLAIVFLVISSKNDPDNGGDYSAGASAAVSGEYAADFLLDADDITWWDAEFDSGEEGRLLFGRDGHIGLEYGNVVNSFSGTFEVRDSQYLTIRAHPDYTNVEEQYTWELLYSKDGDGEIVLYQLQMEGPRSDIDLSGRITANIIEFQ